MAHRETAFSGHNNFEKGTTFVSKLCKCVDKGSKKGKKNGDAPGTLGDWCTRKSELGVSNFFLFSFFFFFLFLFFFVLFRFYYFSFSFPFAFPFPFPFPFPFLFRLLYQDWNRLGCTRKTGLGLFNSCFLVFPFLF